MGWREDIAAWSVGVLDQFNLPVPSGYTWSMVLNKLKLEEERLWNLRGELSRLQRLGLLTTIEANGFNRARIALYSASYLCRQGLLDAGVAAQSLPSVTKMPELATQASSLPGAMAGAFGATPYHPGRANQFAGSEFAASFGDASFGWAQVALAYFGGAVLLAIAGGIIAAVILDQMAPNEAAAAIEATHAQVSVLEAVRESQREWTGLCQGVITAGGSCVEELGERPVLPITDIADLGVSAPVPSVFGSPIAWGLVGAGTVLIGYLGYRLYKRTH